jgi:hypothetical protein
MEAGWEKGDNMKRRKEKKMKLLKIIQKKAYPELWTIKGVMSGITWDKDEKEYNLEWRLIKSRMQFVIFEIIGIVAISISIIILIIYFLKKIVEFRG